MDGTLSGMRLSAVAIGGTVVAGLLGLILSPVVGELGAIGLIAGALMLAAWYGNLASAVGSAVIGVAAAGFLHCTVYHSLR